MSEKPAFRVYSVRKMGSEDWWMEVGRVHKNADGFDFFPSLDIHQFERLIIRPYIEDKEEQHKANERFNKRSLWKRW